MILAQSETERFLEEQANQLGVRVERSVQILNVQDQGDKVRSRLRHAQGNEEEVFSDFVLGADGAHSIVRKEAGIDFKGDA